MRYEDMYSRPTMIGTIYLLLYPAFEQASDFESLGTLLRVYLLQ